MLNMRGNLITAGVLLVIAFVFVRTMRAQSKRSQLWLTIIAFLCAPVIGIGVFVADVFLILPYSYIYRADYIESLIPILLIGVMVGTASAAVVWTAQRLRK